ncbi:bifunctional DNA primase/polymerase [Alkaliphilus transvaalensis]|uniref:bifunctional DNA primase/polymerase n=1 Tax=Alkaliphilus transvaalensis TaxID=114628 RepID=UPI000479A0F9|nr:bifunctional DNA primase/polymerase [Alkaliphilus transvaalensis]
MRKRNNVWSALDYANKGWSVVPLHTPTKEGCSCTMKWNCKSKGKHPRTQNGLKDATTNEYLIRKWWKDWPDANIGIVTGDVSGLIAIDIDPRHGGDDSLEELIYTNERLPDTVESLTGGGGRHILFKCRGDSIKSTVNILPGIDIRGDGGYIVAPPSLHVSGDFYQWELSSHPDNTDIADLPKWLFRILNRSKHKSKRDTQKWRDLVLYGVKEGERNMAVTSLTGHLLAHRIDPVITYQLIYCWNQICNEPPLPNDELKRVVDSIAGRELEKRAKVGKK